LEHAIFQLVSAFTTQHLYTYSCVVFCGPGERSRYSDSLRLGSNPSKCGFSAPVQTGPGAHPASYTMVTGCLPGGVKRPGRDANHPTPSSAEVKEIVEIYFFSPFGPSWPVLGRTLPCVFFLLLPSVPTRSYFGLFEICQTILTRSALSSLTVGQVLRPSLLAL
jgi:hypothetical protein